MPRETESKVRQTLRHLNSEIAQGFATPGVPSNEELGTLFCDRISNINGSENWEH